MSEVENIKKTVRELAPDYFRNPKDYFWRWVEKGKIIEWFSRDTLCYREELARVLRGLTEQGLPPLGAVLLLIAGCADTWPVSGDMKTELWQMWQRIPTGPATYPSEVQWESLFRQVMQFLDVVRALPADLRTGEPKLHLFREVFSAQAPHVSADLAQALVDEWESGRSDVVLHFSRNQVSREEVLRELYCLKDASYRFPTTEALALHLRTGLDKLPAPLPEPVPIPPAQPDGPADLLDELAGDQRTAGLARLTRQLVAALHIPLHTRGASEQPLGGVADISNRGNFDRLLLSELAYDDASLMARLVNNEALYLRRETPPRPDVKPRTILLDTTLHLWGLPRVFALAAALAWASNSRQSPGPASVTAYALGGHDFTPLDLATLAGVVEALASLDPALHCGASLQAFVREQASTDATDCLLITEAGVLHLPEFSLLLAVAQPALRFLLTVDRSGALELYELLNGHRTLVSTARYDLDELLFAATPPPPRRPVTNPLLPAFLQEEPAPLYFPVTGLRMAAHNSFYAPSLGVLAVTDTRRVLHWPDRKYGAREVLPLIENGGYFFGSDDDNYLYVLVTGLNILKVYLIHYAGPVESIDLGVGLESYADAMKTVFRDNCFFISQPGSVLMFNCQSRTVSRHSDMALPAVPAYSFQPLRQAKSFINNGYNVLHRITRIGVNEAGELVLDGHCLRVVSSAAALSPQLRLSGKGSDDGVLRDVVPVNKDQEALTANPLLLFRRFVWPNGSTALVDPCGLLHLRSADASVPEITLVLVLNQPSAAWAADGSVCGPEYFTGPYRDNLLPVPDFYRLYLQRFIAQLG